MFPLVCVCLSRGWVPTIQGPAPPAMFKLVYYVVRPVGKASAWHLTEMSSCFNAVERRQRSMTVFRFRYDVFLVRTNPRLNSYLQFSHSPIFQYHWYLAVNGDHHLGFFKSKVASGKALVPVVYPLTPHASRKYRICQDKWDKIEWTLLLPPPKHDSHCVQLDLLKYSEPAKRLSHAGLQEVSRFRTGGESEESITCQCQWPHKNILQIFLHRGLSKVIHNDVPFIRHLKWRKVNTNVVVTFNRSFELAHRFIPCGVFRIILYNEYLSSRVFIRDE